MEKIAGKGGTVALTSAPGWVMKTQYKGYLIQIQAKEESGRWTADIELVPKFENH